MCPETPLTQIHPPKTQKILLRSRSIARNLSIKMNRINARNFLITLLLALAQAKSAAAVELFVATTGNDGQDGKSLATAFGTIVRARDEIRLLEATGSLPAGGVTVEIAGGKYDFTNTLKLTAADSGTAAAPISYRAWQNQPVEILGGRVLKLSEFRPVDSGSWLARLDPAARGHVLQGSIRALGLQHAGPFPPVFSDSGGLFELFWNGRRLPLAVWPNTGWTTMKRAVVNGDAHTPGTFEYRGERPARWLNNPDIWLKGQWRVPWEDPAIRVARIDPASHTITFAAGLPAGIGNKYARPAGNGLEPWRAVNLVEEIDQPGEWAVDFATQTLFFWPPAGDGELVVSQLNEPLIELQGAAHVHLIGLTLEASLGDGIVVQNGESDLIAGCTLRNLGRRGVVLNGFRSGVQSCDMYQLGEGCIYVSGGNKARLTPSENFVVNNHLHDYAVLKAMYSPAVDAGFGGLPNGGGFTDAVGIRVAHNLIHDAPRDAVLVSGQDNVFEYNEIYHCGFGSGDVGAFYSWLDWTIRGVIIRYNYIHDTVGGVNPDDGAAGSLVWGNVFAGARTGVWIASGPDHRVENNIFIKDQGPVFGMDDRGAARGYATNSRLHTAVLAIHPQQAPWAERFPAMTNFLASHPELPLRTEFARNLIVLHSGEPIQLKMSQERQGDTNLFLARDNYVTAGDPGFVNAAAGNYTLKPDAEVFQKIAGFEPVPFDQMGLQIDQYRRSLPPEIETGRHRFQPSPGPGGDRNFGT